MELGKTHKGRHLAVASPEGKKNVNKIFGRVYCICLKFCEVLGNSASSLLGKNESFYMKSIQPLWKIYLKEELHP